MRQTINDTYEIDDDTNRTRYSQVQEMLKHAYWCEDISEAEIRKGVSNSALVLGAYDNQGDQVAFMRVVSDKTRFAYIMDVYVHPGHRKRGIASTMVRFALAHPDFADVYQWLLATKDAHDVYERVGFTPLKDTWKWMAVITPRPCR